MLKIQIIYQKIQKIKTNSFQNVKNTNNISKNTNTNTNNISRKTNSTTSMKNYSFPSTSSCRISVQVLNGHGPLLLKKQPSSVSRVSLSMSSSHGTNLPSTLNSAAANKSASAILGQKSTLKKISLFLPGLPRPRWLDAESYYTPAQPYNMMFFNFQFLNFQFSIFLF